LKKELSLAELCVRPVTHSRPTRSIPARAPWPWRPSRRGHETRTCVMEYSYRLCLTGIW
jgi:hypothetical protein